MPVRKQGQIDLCYGTDKTLANFEIDCKHSHSCVFYKLTACTHIKSLLMSSLSLSVMNLLVLSFSSPVFLSITSIPLVSAWSYIKVKVLHTI